MQPLQIEWANQQSITKLPFQFWYNKKQMKPFKNSCTNENWKFKFTGALNVYN